MGRDAPDALCAHTPVLPEGAAPKDASHLDSAPEDLAASGPTARAARAGFQSTGERPDSPLGGQSPRQHQHLCSQTSREQRPDQTRPAGWGLQESSPWWGCGLVPPIGCPLRVPGLGIPLLGVFSARLPWAPWAVPPLPGSAWAIPLHTPSQLCSRSHAGMPQPALGQSCVASYLSRLPFPWGAGCHPIPALLNQGPSPPAPSSGCQQRAHMAGWALPLRPWLSLPKALGVLPFPGLCNLSQSSQVGLVGLPSVSRVDCWGAQSLQPCPPLPPKEERSQGPRARGAAIADCIEQPSGRRSPPLGHVAWPQALGGLKV